MRANSFLMGAVLLAGATLLTAPKALADQVFDLSGVSLVYGGTLTGSFTTNNALTSVTAYNIVASSGPGSPGFTFSGNDYTQGDSTITINLVNRTFQVDETSGGQSYELRLVFPTVLSATGSVALTTGSSYESENLAGNRSVTAGSVVPVSAATPEPSALVLLGTGMLGVGGMLRRRIFSR